MCACQVPGWIDWHVQLEKLAAPGKLFPDDLGKTIRRVLAIRTSTDGITWHNTTTEGEQCGTVVPDPNRDPPDMEFAGLMPFWYGDRIAAVVTNYAPSPIAANPAAAGGSPSNSQDGLVGVVMQQVCCNPFIHLRLTNCACH